MRQNQILDGIEGIHPLPLRAQHLLQQPQILCRNTQRLRRRFQKLQFFPGVAPAAGAAERKHSDHRFFALHWQQHYLMNTALPQLLPLRLRQRREFHHRCPVLLEHARLGFIRPGLAHPGLKQGPQEFRRQAGVLGRHQTVAFHQLEPRSLRPHYGFQFLQRSLDHRGMILSARNRDRQLIQHRQPAGAQPRVVQHHQQDARTEQHFRQQITFTGNATGKGKPVQIQRQQSGAEQKRPEANPAEPVAQQFDERAGRNQPACHIQPQPDVLQIRKIQRPHGGADQQHPRDGHQRRQRSPRVRRQQRRRCKQPYRQH